MHRTFAVPSAVLLAAVLAACGEKEAAPAADSAATAAAAPAAPAPTLADFAGDFTWKTKPETGDSVLATGTSHTNPDGTGWVVNDMNKKDTVRFTSAIVGDSIIQTSSPYTDATQPKAGQLIFRYAGLAKPDAGGGVLAFSPAAKPDTVVMRARAEVTKK